MKALERERRLRRKGLEMRLDRGVLVFVAPIFDAVDSVA